MTTPSLAERGRRAGAAALLVVVTAAVAEAIMAHPEPTPAALLASTPPTTISRAATPRAASSTTTSAVTIGATPTAPTTARPADPRAVAVAWYAERHRLDRSRVQALQTNRLKGPAVRYRVLLLVTKPGGRLDSAVVTVTRSGRVWRAEASRG